MVGITLSPEQIRAAPPEVRRWLEHELAVSLGLNPPALPITQSSSPRLAACTPEEAAQVLSLIQGMLPVVHVFFELGREGAAPGEGIEAFRLADIMRHTRLEVPDQVLACLEVLDQAVQRVRNDPSATFHAVDERGYCLVAAQTQRSIRAIWQQLMAQRKPVRPAVSSPTEGPLSARLAPDMFPACHRLDCLCFGAGGASPRAGPVHVVGRARRCLTMASAVTAHDCPGRASGGGR